MKHHKKCRQAYSLWELLGSFASRLLLALSLLFILASRICEQVQTHVCGFYYDHVYHRLRGMRSLYNRVRTHRVQALSLIMTIVLLVPMASILRPAVAVKVDGRMLGYVKNESEVTAAFRQIEQESSEILGEPFHIDADISYEVAVTSPKNLLQEQDLNTAIAASANNIETLSVVKVNGQAVAAVNDAEEAQTVLTKMKDNYRGDDPDAEVTLLDHVSVETMQAPTQLLTSEDELFKTLTTKTPAEVVEATEEDTLTSIAQSNGMFVDEILALNPDIVPEKLAPGTEVVIEPAKPLVSVEVKKTIDYTEAIPYDTVTRQSGELAQNKVQVIRQGIPGEAAIQAEVVLVNGEEQERTILSRTVLSDATDKIVEVGTKKMGIGTGNLRRPIAGGTLTSGFKWRWGRMHKGVDISASTGTSVMAADDGKVIVAGYSKSGYGNYVIINHGNGMKTLYAHNSVLKVNVGDVVEKGQTIALSGNTGRSTGPHCHFEVLVDDVNVDPMKYIG